MIIKYRNLQWANATDPTLEPAEPFDRTAVTWGELDDPQTRRDDLDQYLTISGEVWQVSYSLIVVTEETEDEDDI